MQLLETPRLQRAGTPSPFRALRFKAPTLGSLTLAALLLTALLQPLLALPAEAASQTVTLKALGAEEVVYLPTIRAQREFTFTKPRDWAISGATAKITFQHSEQLIPGSWLQIIVNDKVLKHVPLTKANTQGSSVTVPIPASLLETFNRLILRVEQHYAIKCEDPVDPSLWTNVLNDSTLTFNYSEKTPKLSLKNFPYPVVDQLAYKPTPLRYVVGQNASPEALQAMGLLNVIFAQAHPREALVAHAQTSASGLPGSNENVIILGTLDELTGDAKSLAAKAGANSLGSNEGLVAVVTHPKKAGNVALIVTGKTPQATLRAAQYLASRNEEAFEEQPAKVIGSDWSPVGGGTAYPPYIATESRTLAELGYGVQVTEKITAPPITLDIPVVTSFKDPSSNLVLDLNYSYSPKLNPKYSALELRLNDRAFASIPLLNQENGEERASAQVPVPRELLKTDNKFVAKFHLMPDKYGFCVDEYEDDTFGKIHEDTRLLVQSTPASKLPDVSLLSLGRGYPYTLKPDLGNTHIALSELNATQLDALLAVTSRLGRHAGNTVAPQLTVGMLDDGVDLGKHVVIIDQAKDLNDTLNNTLDTSYRKGGQTLFIDWQGNESRAQLGENASNTAALLEMGMSGNSVVTRLSAPTPEGLKLLTQLWNNDEAFEAIAEGDVVRVANTKTTASADETKELTVTESGAAPMAAAGNWWSSLWAKPWFQWTVYALLILFGLFFVVPLLVNLFKGKGRK